MKKKALIVGGGIAGLTAATLLQKAGMEVTILEASSAVGGLAKTDRTDSGYPTEHSLRVYHQTYKCLFSILQNIPFDERTTVFDQLTTLSAGMRHQEDFLIYERDRKKGWIYTLRDHLKLMQFFRRHGLTYKDFWLLLKDEYVVRFCEERLLLSKAINTSLGDILKKASPAYRRLIFSNFEIILGGATEKSAALPAVQLGTEGTPFSPNFMMNGPTSERMVTPWERYLIAQGVIIKKQARVMEFLGSDQHITSVRLESGECMNADIFVCAASNLEAMRLLKTSACLQNRTDIQRISVSAEWSKGVQFFLSSVPQIEYFKPGFAVSHMHTPWRLVSVVQAEGFWQQVQLPEGCGAVLSVTFSNVSTNGIVYGKPLLECTLDEIFEEILAQCGFEGRHLILERHINKTLAWYSNEDFIAKKDILPAHYAHQQKNGQWIVNFVPLSGPTVENFKNAPQARTSIKNFYLAGDYCKTTMFITCMEKASESGYLVAQAISEDLGLSVKIKLPFVSYNKRNYAFFRTLDAFLFKWQTRISRYLSLICRKKEKVQNFSD